MNKFLQWNFLKITYVDHVKKNKDFYFIKNKKLFLEKNDYHSKKN